MRERFEKLLVDLKDHSIDDLWTDYVSFPSDFLTSIANDYKKLINALEVNQSLNRVRLKGSYYCDHIHNDKCLAGYLQALSKVPTLKQLIVMNYSADMTSDTFINALKTFVSSASHMEYIEIQNLDFSKADPKFLTEFIQSVQKSSIRMDFINVIWPAKFDLNTYQSSGIKRSPPEPVAKLSFENLAKSVSARAPKFNVLPYPMALPRDNTKNRDQELAAVAIQRAWRAQHKRAQSLVPHPSFFPELRKRLPKDIDPNPSVPTQPIRAINALEKTRFLALIKDQRVRLMVDEVLDKHLMYITFHDLLVSLRRCINHFNQWLVGHPETVNVLLATNDYKSQGWIAAFAAHYLTVLPKATYSVDSEMPAELIDQNGPTVIFMPDDGAYSGTQICQNIRRQFQSLRKLNQPLDIFIVIPFMTTKAYRALKELHAELTQEARFKGFLNFHIVRDKTLPSLEELPLSAAAQNGVPVFQDKHKTVCLTEWKKPDSFSVSPLFSEAYIDSFLSNDGGMYYFNTMPDITPPYKYKIEEAVARAESGVPADPLNRGGFIINRLVTTHRDFARLGPEKHKAIANYLAEHYSGAPLDANTLLQDDIFMHQYIFPLCLYNKKNQYAHIALFKNCIIDALYMNQTQVMKENLEEYLRLIVIPGVEDLYQEIVDSNNDYDNFVLRGLEY